MAVMANSNGMFFPQPYASEVRHKYLSVITIQVKRSGLDPESRNMSQHLIPAFQNASQLQKMSVRIILTHA